MITEDEVMGLLERADPARDGNAAPTIDAAKYLDALRTRGSDLTIIETTTTSAKPTIRHHWLIVTTAAAALVAFVAGALVLAARDDPITQVPAAQPVEPPATEPALPPPPLPEEFTVCVASNSPTQVGTDDVWEVPSPDGVVVIEQGTGSTYRGMATSSDPRFEGTHYLADNGAEYNYEGGGTADNSGPEINGKTQRIENDEGAWQGSTLSLDMPDDTSAGGRAESGAGPVVLIGEGAYEGLTAIAIEVTGGGCFLNLQGYVMQVPGPPVPYTGE